MSGGVLTLLLVVWAGVLLPNALRDRQRSPVVTVDGFTEAMRRLGGADQAAPVVARPPTPRQRMLARRRAVLLRLAGAASAAVAAWALAGGSVLAWVAVLAVVLLVAYLAALRFLAVRRRTRDAVIVLPTTEPAATGARRPTEGVPSPASTGRGWRGLTTPAADGAAEARRGWAGRAAGPVERGAM